MRLIGLAAVLATLSIPVGAEAQTTPPSRPCEPVEAVTIDVVPLTYARAGELACTLSLVAAPSVRLVPYNPTHILIISGLRRRSSNS